MIKDLEKLIKWGQTISDLHEDGKPHTKVSEEVAKEIKNLIKMSDNARPVFMDASEDALYGVVNIIASYANLNKNPDTTDMAGMILLSVMLGAGIIMEGMDRKDSHPEVPSIVENKVLKSIMERDTTIKSVQGKEYEEILRLGTEEINKVSNSGDQLSLHLLTAYATHVSALLSEKDVTDIIAIGNQVVYEIMRFGIGLIALFEKNKEKDKKDEVQKLA